VRRISSVPALLFEAQLSGFTQSLPFALFSMACLTHYWSLSEFWRLRVLNQLLRSCSFAVKFIRGIVELVQPLSSLNMVIQILIKEMPLVSTAPCGLGQWPTAADKIFLLCQEVPLV